MIDWTWETRLAAIQAFAGDVDLKMRKPGDWYVSCGMHIGGDGVLVGSYGNGRDPEEAVDAHWVIYESLPHNRYAHVGNGDETRRARWNGFMWEHITQDRAEAMMQRDASTTPETING